MNEYFKTLRQKTVFMSDFRIIPNFLKYFLASLKKILLLIAFAFAFAAAPRPKHLSISSDDLVEPELMLSFKKENVYKTFCELFGTSNIYVQSPCVQLLDYGHLVPSGDFIFNSHKHSTFKMINIRAQFHTINSQNWNTLECW